MTPTRYPLQWPVGWKRTTAGYRTTAKFARDNRRLTVYDGVQRVLQELERLGVNENDIVVSTNVETRLDGLPRSDRGEPGDTGVCVYWRKRRQGAEEMRCMAVDQYTRVADNLAAIAATLEAMRAIQRHGGAAILDRAFTGFTALPAPIVAGMKRPWRDVLGFPGDAIPDVDQVRRAYSRLAMLLHPDRDTGDGDKMAELNVARDEALGELR